ncbi:hypothetical protein ACFL3X_00125 [Gemmatimonadota bacterium]
MTKTQRELLILGGILVVIVVILLLRQGGEGDTLTTPVTTNEPSAGQTVAPGTSGTAQPPGTENPQTLLITQAPAEMLNPMLSDSAIAARIESGSIRDPFASDHRITSRNPSRQPTRQPTRAPDPPTPREDFLDDWPEDVQFQMLIERADAPGFYSARFNGQLVAEGGKLPGTEWVLIEASKIQIVIKRVIQTSTRHEITWYYYRPLQSMETDR